MSFANPTALRIGMQGMLDGRRHTVLGRVVLGVVVDGETYYWNEFNVADDEGRQFTLVFEETENGPTWKLFRMFEPAKPMSAREAAGHLAGERFTFDGMALHVTLVDTSRVYHIEGDAPVGTEVGDIANYFNAETADRVVVVSWTGDEVEFYEGHDLPAGRIESVFNLPKPRAFSLFQGGSSQEWDWSWLSGWGGRAVFFVVIAFLWMNSGDSCSHRSAPPLPPPKQPAPARLLAVGTHGVLGGRDYTIAAHALVEIAQMGLKFDRHEYVLTDEFGDQVLLVSPLTGNAGEWFLLKPVAPAATFTPYAAAALKEDRPATIDHRSVRVMQLFLSRVLAKDGAAAGWSTGAQYGLLARANDGDWLLVRWTETEIELYSGRLFTEAEVQDAFKGR